MFRRVVFAGLLSTSLVACATAPVARQAAAPSDCSLEETGGVRNLCHELVIPAPREEVWRLFASTQGLSSWLAPVAAIDLQIGGTWESSYRRDARLGDPGNIRNRILSYNPQRMLSIAVDNAPPGFPEPELVRNVWTVIEFEPVGRTRTRVRVSMLGYREGAGYDRLYAMFKMGNAETLTSLHGRVMTGPTDWETPRNETKAAHP